MGADSCVTRNSPVNTLEEGEAGAKALRQKRAGWWDMSQVTGNAEQGGPREEQRLSYGVATGLERAHSGAMLRGFKVSWLNLASRDFCAPCLIFPGYKIVIKEYRLPKDVRREKGSIQTNSSDQIRCLACSECIGCQGYPHYCYGLDFHHDGTHEKILGEGGQDQI